MADQRFTISDQLGELGLDLNTLPLLEGCTQLSLKRCKKGIQLHH